MTAVERIKAARAAWVIDQHMDWILAVKRHAEAHYEENGWDYVIEAWEDRDIAEAIGTAKTEKGAIWNVARAVKVLGDYRADIKATAF